MCRTTIRENKKPLFFIAAIPSIALILLLTGCVDKGASFGSLYEIDVADTISDATDLFINAPPPGASVRGAAVIVFSSNGITSPEVSVDGSTWTAASSGTTLLSDIPGYDALSETDFNLLIQGMDGTGALLSDSVTIVKDETAPLAMLNNPKQGGLVNSQTILSFQDLDFISIEASVDNTNWISVIPDAATFADFPQFPGVAEGSAFTLYVRGEDAAGNPAASSIGLVREPASASSFNSSFTIYFDTSSSGASVTSDVTNIPILVRITNPAIFAAVRPGAPDIRFYDTDGSQMLDYEIERWDPGNNLGEIWVLVPRIDGNSNSDFITLYYDDNPHGTVLGGQNSASVFSSGNFFAGVWHLNKDPVAEISDSTGSSNSGTQNNMSAANLVDGAVGKGYSFDGSDEWIGITNFNVIMSDATFSAWINVTSSSANEGILYSREAKAEGLNIKNSGGLFLGYHWNDAGNTYNWKGPGINTAEWVFVAVTIQPDGGHVGYVGAGGAFTSLDNNVTSAGNLAIDDLKIGVDEINGGRYFNGIIDEPRVSTAVRSPEWLKISYENQRPGSTMLSFCDGNDITPPIVAINSSGVIYDSETITFTISETNSPILSIDNSAWIAAVSGVTKYTDVPGFDALADGPFTLYLKDTDGCRKTGIANAPLTKDSYDASSFISSVELRFDTTLTGADVGVSVDNFPLLVRLGPAEAAIIGAVRSGAPDIRFLDSDGVTFLDYEIERWDQANDLAEIWVRVPRIDGDSDTDFITMLFDDVDGNVSDGQNPGGVFSAVNDFAGVWHLNKAPDVSLADSTGNSNSASGNNMDAANLVNGAVGKGHSFNGSDEWIDLTDFNVTVSDVTFSAWINVSNYDADDGIIISRGTAAEGLNLESSGGLFLGYHWNDASNTWNWKGPAFNTGEWVFVAITIQTSGGNIGYVGAGGTLTSLSNNVTSAANLVINELKIGVDEFNGGRYFDGIIDEARVSTEYRSPEWIKLTYENQKNGQTLVTILP